MPIKYIGRQSYCRGKFIFHILCNLRNFGVGRIVVRSRYEELHPGEPTFYKIVKVEPKMDPDLKEGKVWVEKTFRGHKYDEHLELTQNEMWAADFRLLHKHEEEEYCKSMKPPQPIKILPATGPIPPLLREVILRDWKKRGETSQEPMMKYVYKIEKQSRVRVAQEGEVPTVEFPKGHMYVRD